jgi:sterol desaturase/sphingolipid hydroxylase (fatty acid hydroxylase superfamily)
MFHKVHHEYKQPVTIAAENAHILEFILANNLPTQVGALILGSKVHIWTFTVWGMLRVLETTECHSGFELPWSIFKIIPFGADASYHDFHHSKSVGNYSTFMTIWDTIFNTNTDFYE